MKIVFIEPSNKFVHVYSRFKLPRLGSLILGTILKNAGYEVCVYMEDFFPVPVCSLKEADLVAISTITSTAPRAYEIADYVRSLGKQVIIGGPHVTFMTNEALEYFSSILILSFSEILLPSASIQA